jgi:formylglycine-generating enzyme required for sulfatase activity
MATPEPPRHQPPSARLGEALAWLRDHSLQAEASPGTGSLELAEVLWLAARLPPSAPVARGQGDDRHPSRLQSRPKALESPPAPRVPLEPKEEPGSKLPLDPCLPSPFPQTPKAAAVDPLLPVAVLPDDADVRAALAGATLPGRVRASQPFGERGDLLRALAPLLRRRPDPARLRLDEAATEEAYAQSRLLLPVMVPAQGAAFSDVVVLVDGGLSMEVWRQQAEELRQVLASSQVFARVRRVALDPATLPAGGAEGRLRSVAQLLPGGSPLLLMMSDTAGRHWWDGRMLKALEACGRLCPTAILQPLPPWQWGRTALAVGERVAVRNAHPGAANSRYVAELLAEGESPVTGGSALPVPVLRLDRLSLAIWSAVVMGDPTCASSGVLLPEKREREKRRKDLLGERDLQAPAPAPAPLDREGAKERWRAFQELASPEAQRLLRLMATAPVLTLPIIALLKDAMVPDATGPLPIAEVLISGLVARRGAQRPALSAAEPPPLPDQLQFEVLPVVAALLRERLSAADRLDVIRRISSLVERRWNRVVGQPSFEAVLFDPATAPPERFAGVVQFAAVTARLLEGLPGQRARVFAERIRQGSGLPPPASPWPASMVFEERAFDTAQLLTARPLETMHVVSARFVEVETRRIAFITAAVTSTGGVRRQDAEARAFHEPLRRDTLPFGATAERGDPLTLTLVQLPAGEFRMGSAEGEEGGYSDEKPLHRVELASFFMGQTPITQAQWREVAQWTERTGERWGRQLNPSPSRFQAAGKGEARLLEGEASTDQRPVERVSWEEALEFCHRLSQRTGRSYMLPSEAQWEYACRAGTTTPFAFGETLTPELANYNGNYTYANGPKGEDRAQTTPVGMFPANAWGLHDMHGNVWEWCLDDWHQSYEEAPEDGSAWLINQTGLDRGKGAGRRPNAKESGGDGTETGDKLLRGGSWFIHPGSCRSACRGLNAAVHAYDSVGFRVVCLPQGPSLNP